jgi:hypothetical protein
VEPLVVWFAVTWVVLGLGCWLGYQLVLQNGRILLRLEALEARRGAASRPRKPRFAGVPAGSLLVDFDLPNLSVGRMTLSRWRGRRVVLIFLDPGCAHSRGMLPALAALPPDPPDGRPVPLVLTTGDADANRRLVEAHGVRCPVLLQEDREVASLYRVAGTPRTRRAIEGARGRHGAPPRIRALRRRRHGRRIGRLAPLAGLGGGRSG